MLRNYVLISIRNLRKHFSYSLINIFGLSLGLTTCILLVIWIRHELSYDRFHEKSENIYRASLEMSFGGREVRTTVSPTALLPALQQFPEVQAGVRVYNPASWNPYIVRREGHLFQESKFYFADSTFFEVFSFRLLSGDPESALKEPNSVILTTSTAKKYFGDQDPMGQILTVNETKSYKVTGVMEDVPSNSFLRFDFLGSFSSLRAGREQPIWWSANYQTFVVLNPAADIDGLSRKLDALVRKELASELTNENDYVHYHLMKLTDIYLRSPYDGEFEVVGSIQYVYVFSAIAALILLIACINYVNLATARAVDRAREVGIRKVVGAEKRQLFIQFLGESAVITLIAFAVAFVAAQLLLPLFNEAAGKVLDTSVFYEPSFAAISVLLLIAIALLAGAYPAIAITSFKPVSVLKGNFRFSAKGAWLRKTLVVTQFVISITLIVGTLVIMRQLDYMSNKKLGYQKENIIVLPLDEQTEKVYGQLGTELIRTGTITAIGRATESPTRISGGYGFAIEGQEDAHGQLVTAVAADTGFIPALGMEILSGRNFNDADFSRVETDTFYSFIINEALLKSLYIDAEKAIGMRARVSGRKGEIVGVVRDFHFSSLHAPIGPLAIFSEADYNHIFIKVESSDMSASLSKVRKICASVLSHRPFEYELLDQQYDNLYASEQRMGMIFSIFSTLAILLACLGLLGLVSFSASQKTREIGIRKVLGATPANIVFLITSDFTRLVVIAILIGLPSSYWMMSRWLDDFAYRTNIGAEPVLLAAVICLVIAFGTAGVQAIKAALTDPARTLRTE